MDYNIDLKLKALLDKIRTGFDEILGDTLTGIYIHGSVAFDCFNWNSSDLDFIVVIESLPDFESRKNIIRLLLHLDRYAPKKGIEMSMVLKKHCNPFVYPTPYCLHFSNSHKEAYVQDITGHLNLLQGVDKDLAAHFTVINHVGITLCGTDKTDVFGDIPKEYYLDSIIHDIENAAEEITENPVYFILNLCRVLAFIKQGKVLSKAEGGIWGVENLTQFSDIIEKALECYTFSVTGQFDNDKLFDMAEHILKEIYK